MGSRDGRMAEVVVALDMPNAHDALAMVDRLPGLVWAKIGSVLFTAEGPTLARELRARNVSVFLDLKWHDIPETVGGVAARARDLDVQLATVHAFGGAEMLQAAVASAGAALPLVAVTVLTSLDVPTLTELVGRDVPDLEGEVLRLARMAVDAGCAGVVASAHEVAALREVVGDVLLVVPGIRRPGDPLYDQRRVAGPRETAQAGATHLVVGRPITGAPDPAAAYAEFQELAQC
jgi:orotidine-5'-phosphate decarboxylase